MLLKKQSAFVDNAESQFLNLKKCIAFVILLCFSFSSSAEARSPKHPNIRHANKLQTQKAAVRGKHLAAPKARARRIATPQRRVSQVQVPKARAKQLIVSQRRASRVAGPKQQANRVVTPQRRITKFVASRALARKLVVSQRTAKKLAAPRARTKQAVVQKPAVVPVKPQVINYLSLLKSHTQRNAKLGELDHLYSKNISGGGQTVAVIEYSGGWQQMKDVINNKWLCSNEIRERYKHNFLTPIGSKVPGSLHPEKKNHWVEAAMRGNDSHPSSVSSVVMDLAPQTKVKPVSTYNSPETPTQPRHFYDISDALMDLSTHKDVGIINISGGWIDVMGSELKREYDINGNTIYMCKTGYSLKIIESFKAVAKAGKVVVLAAGNDSREIQPLQFKQEYESGRDELIAHLLETLDPKTRKSILITGNIDPNTRKLCSTSNKAGDWVVSQERYLALPGYNMSSYVNYIEFGSSYAAPYLCAVIALLASKGYAPQRVAQALLETAEKDPDKRTYGSGRMIRAGKALEYLEKGN